MLTNFAKFTGKYLCKSLFFNKHLLATASETAPINPFATVSLCSRENILAHTMLVMLRLAKEMFPAGFVDKWNSINNSLCFESLRENFGTLLNIKTWSKKALRHKNNRRKFIFVVEGISHPINKNVQLWPKFSKAKFVIKISQIIPLWNLTEASSYKKFILALESSMISVI